MGSWFSRFSSKIKRKRKIEEVKATSRAIAKKTKREIQKRIFQVKAAISRMQRQDKRKTPIYLLTFDEIDELMKGRSDTKNRDYLDLIRGRF
ncbi:hypothetical protein N8Z24_00760 [bacterium]|nr:hypothetical protein [bacterium]